MSRAFVKETAGEAPPPERMVSEGANPVTPAGLAQIAAHVARLEAALKTEANVLLRETLARDLRYWAVRRASAAVQPPPRPGGPVAFGARVTLRRKGRAQTFRLVGEDEADPPRGLLNIRSPLAEAILGAAAGETVEAPEPLGEIEIVAVE